MSARHLVWALAALAASACGDGEDLAGPGAKGSDSGSGDPEKTEVCLSCHAPEAEAWQNPSSHRSLFACTTCHAELKKTPGPGHADKPACADCHSEEPHPTSNAACTGCHDQHGSLNIFLIRQRITRPDGTSADVHFTAPEGASADGLVHTGAAVGTGLCETCHTETAHYLASGQGSPHYAEHCTECHQHQVGFAKP